MELNRSVPEESAGTPPASLAKSSIWGREDSRGRTGKPTECVRRSNSNGECKGAFRKTSGRSNFPNAPLRATSSYLNRSMFVANRNALLTRIDTAWEQVGFARGRKLLRSHRNILCRPAADFLNQRGIRKISKHRSFPGRSSCVIRLGTRETIKLDETILFPL